MFHMLSGTELNCVRKLSNTQSMVVNSPSIVDSLNISRCLVVSESTIKGVKRRPTYEELMHVVDHLVRFRDRSATVARDSPAAYSY